MRPSIVRFLLCSTLAAGLSSCAVDTSTYSEPYYSQSGGTVYRDDYDSDYGYDYGYAPTYSSTTIIAGGGYGYRRPYYRDGRYYRAYDRRHDHDYDRSRDRDRDRDRNRGSSAGRRDDDHRDRGGSHSKPSIRPAIARPSSSDMERRRNEIVRRAQSDDHRRGDVSRARQQQSSNRERASQQSRSSSGSRSSGGSKDDGHRRGRG